ncbi:MAG: ABC transporter ATP-binding protein/permease, partial [Oscillospiraceae bacterium]|nr:ABC transporter ATP-binding protein/permease [Oscillospiraceae bacterium]
GNRRKGAPNVSGEVEFRNVSFRYPDSEEYVLHNVSFTAHRGETVAIIGSTGSGKSTLINLVPRFYDVTEGQVLVDGADVREYAHYDLNNKIGYVSQKATLFSGTVRSNIAFGDNGRDAAQMQAAVPAAAATAQASEFVEKLPDGYDGYVAQLGRNFSGGQKQRISIARAVCRDAEILIFDDSFSALDYKTDRILRAALRRDCTDATKLIVAQRIGTIRDADRIIVLDRGEVAGIGTHAELMKDCDVYRQIAYSQLSKEELA